MKPNTKIAVCDQCLKSSCVLGKNPCEEHKKNRASIVLKTIRELERLNLESPEFWAVAEKGWRM